MKRIENIKKLEVYWNHFGEKTKVGTLLEDQNRIFFKYDNLFLQNGISLSPFKLNWANEIQEGPAQPFDGLHGLFSDSLPDAWGRLLLDRFLQTKENFSQELSILDRLAYVGVNGSGALEYKPAIDNEFIPAASLINLNTYAESATEVLNQDNTQLISDFYSLAGTSGGARPKVEVGYNRHTGVFTNDKIFPSKEFEPWIIKFPSRFDPPDIAQIEFAYHKMALECGIEMEECKLFDTEKKNDYFFGTKRFDRKNGDKIHTHSLSGLLHDNFQQSTMDYGHILDAVLKLTKNRDSINQVFKLAVFNVFTFNQDDHSKNFSLLMNKEKEWKFAPAYDLTFSPSVYNFHSTSIAGVSSNVNSVHLLKLADYFEIGAPEQIIRAVKKVVAAWPDYASNAKVSKLSANRIKLKLNTHQLGG